jgi:hypothetical protein
MEFGVGVTRVALTNSPMTAPSADWFGTSLATMNVMGLILRVLLIGALAAVAVSLVTTVVLWRTLRRRLRIHPQTPSIAPLHWNLHRGDAAQAHRRLRTASHTALRLGSAKEFPGSSRRLEFESLAESIAQQGVVIERQLVAASRAHKDDRGRALAQPFANIERVEVAVAEFVEASIQWKAAMDSPATPDRLVGVEDRITALRQASEGMQAIDG